VPTAHCQYTLMQASTKGVVRVLPRFLLQTPGTCAYKIPLKSLLPKMGATGLRALLIKEPHLNEGELRDIYLEAQRHISQ